MSYSLQHFNIDETLEVLSWIYSIEKYTFLVRDPVLTAQLPHNSPSDGVGANQLGVALWKSDCPQRPSEYGQFDIFYQCP